MEPLGITCRCGRFVAFKPCLSDANGNKGRLVAVCNGPNSQGESCRTVRWKKGSSASPSSSPPATMPLPSFPAALQAFEPAGSFLAASQTVAQSVFATSAPAGTPRCPISGCGQSRIAPDCQRHFCRKHCIANGGCSSKTHTGALSSSVPPRPATAVQLSGVRVSSPTLTLPPSTTASTGDAPLLQVLSPPMTNTSPAQTSPDLRSLDARPNPRFNSHMPAIFTDQWKREQEMEVDRKRTESEKKVHAAQVKHTVTVYAWSEDSKPAAIQDFQEGPFTWPYFPLSSSVLSALSLAGLETRVQLYRKALSTWVTISAGHVIELQEGARVFLKASHVIDYLDFDKLLNPESTSAPHLRYNLAGERQELRERYKKKALGKGKAIEYLSSSDEGGNNNKKQAPSRRHFCKQTFPAFLFRPTASPSTTVMASTPDVIELSSDDCSSGTQQVLTKRKPSNHGFPSAPKRPKISRSQVNAGTSVVELSDDCDSSPPSSTAVSIKVEPFSGDTAAPQWPADFYAVDIVNFFGACKENPDVRLETLFHRHFPNTPYRCSTVNENCNRWKKAPQLVRDSLLRAKYTDDGKWSVFQKKTRKNGKV
ncbi:hypothetical protein BDZ97DRAFT_301254 [Flammula alnicola]|nr:hypothetical protein BDZ97DRAFT_301254 [Flammula alnicola]